MPLRIGKLGHDARTLARRTTPVRLSVIAFVLAALAVVATASDAFGQVACRYEVLATLGPPACGFGSGVTQARGISPNGRIVVGTNFCPLSGYQPFMWTQQTGMVSVPLPSWLTEAHPADVNDAGVMVGTGPGTQAGQQGFVCDLNTMTWTQLQAQNPPTGWSGATSINSNNAVCGFRSIGSPGDPVNPQTAFIWSAKDGYTDLGVMTGPSSLAFHLAEDGTVVGLTGGNVVSANARAFVWRDGINAVLPPVPNGINSAAFASVGPNRVILQGMTVADGGTYARGWAFFDNTYLNLGILLGHVHLFPRALHASGQVFGRSADVDFGSTAFVWRDGGVRQLASLVESTVIQIEEAIAVSDSGVVIGNGNAGQGAAAIVLAPEYPREGDINCDGIVNVRDLLGVILKWGSCYGCSTDFDGDSMVGYADILAVVANWG